MPVTLPNSYTNAPSRLADVTQTMLDLYNVVQQINGATGTGIGYATGVGAGGTVTQTAGARTNGVTLNKLSGQITGDNTSLAANTSATFIVTNSFVGLNDTISLSVQSGPTANTSIVTVSTVTAGTFSIRISNISTSTADTGAPIINFNVIKGSAN
jgi:hypothetical protein